MKRSLTFLAAALFILSLIGCTKSDELPKDTIATDRAEVSLSSESVTEADEFASPLHAVLDETLGVGFGDTMTMYVKGDEYAADILEFTYGIEPGEHHIADYFVSEQTSKKAYTLAFILFDEEFEKDDCDAVTEAFQNTYLEGLRSALKMYDPEAYAMCDDAVIEGWSLCVDNGVTRNGVYIIISDDNDAAKLALTDALCNVYAKD